MCVDLSSDRWNCDSVEYLNWKLTRNDDYRKSGNKVLDVGSFAIFCCDLLLACVNIVQKRLVYFFQSALDSGRHRCTVFCCCILCNVDFCRAMLFCWC